jgi:hypothetical protein
MNVVGSWGLKLRDAFTGNFSVEKFLAELVYRLALVLISKISMQFVERDFSFGKNRSIIAKCCLAVASLTLLIFLKNVGSRARNSEVPVRVNRDVLAIALEKGKLEMSDKCFNLILNYALKYQNPITVGCELIRRLCNLDSTRRTEEAVHREFFKLNSTERPFGVKYRGCLEFSTAFFSKNLIGREKEFAELSERIKQGSCVLVGPSRSGRKKIAESWIFHQMQGKQFSVVSFAGGSFVGEAELRAAIDHCVKQDLTLYVPGGLREDFLLIVAEHLRDIKCIMVLTPKQMSSISSKCGLGLHRINVSELTEEEDLSALQEASGYPKELCATALGIFRDYPNTFLHVRAVLSEEVDGRRVNDEESLFVAAAQYSGLPVAFFKANANQKAEMVVARLKNSIAGQRDVFDVVKDRLMLNFGNLREEGGVAAIFFCAGPTGVGKTYFGKELGSAMFGKFCETVFFPMSNCTEPHSVSKLIGAPPGYLRSWWRRLFIKSTCRACR